MRVNTGAVLILLAFFSVFLVGAGRQPRQPAEPGAVEQYLEGGIISVSQVGFHSNMPEVAYSSKHAQYLVVFEREDGNGNVVGQFVDAATGSNLGSNFLIAGTTDLEYQPDVVYYPAGDTFTVVYSRGSYGSRDIYAQIVHGSYQSSGSHLTSVPATAIASTAADENSPAVAVNENNGQHVVVYNQGDSAVYGRMFFRLANFLSLLGPSGFNIYSRVETDYTMPDVTWGEDGNTFLVVYQDRILSFPTNVIAAYLHDEHQFSGSQKIGLNCFLAPVNIGDSPLEHDCYSPSVAYDRLDDKYLVVFSHREGEDFFDPGTIHGQYLTSNYGTNCAVFLGNRAFAIETSINPTYATYFFPRVVYSGLSDVFYVTYLSEDDTIMAEPDYLHLFFRMVKFGGKTRIVTPRTLVRDAPLNKSVYHAGMAGSQRGRALVVWGEENTSTSWLVKGQRLIPYLLDSPLVLR
jgi:hypothetical protein